jgi:acyl-CoA reductase-like NAD-dependent aldehyde dehydrogenase
MTTLHAYSPIDQKALGDFAVSTPEAIAQHMAQARIAAVAWAAVPVKQRRQRLAAFTDLVMAQLDSICQTLTETTGKVATEALLGEIYPLLDLARFYQQHAVNILADQGIATSPFAFPGATANIQRRPHGVVAVIAPWNYPFQLAVAPILTALYAGNAVILKPSEFSLPVSTLIIQLFQQLDLPPHLVQSLVGAGDTGQQLIDAGPDMVFFTGGLTAGKAVMARAAQHPIPVMLELGGKDPMVVFESARLDRACAAAVYGAFCNSGQVCISIERLYVQQAVYQSFLDALIAATAQLVVGHNPDGDLGAMTCERQFATLQAHYDDAIAQGAQASGPLRREGHYVWPVVLWNVHHGMRLMQEESFGPLLPVMAFADEAEAIRLANDSPWGLNASIWSGDLAQAQRVAQQLQVGNWAINDAIKNVGHPGLPFGGVKKSGFGRYHGAEGLRQFSVTVAGLTSRSHFPQEPNWFPYNAQRYQQFKGYLDFVYGSGSLWQRLKRNRAALEAFRDYSAFDITQRWHNLKLLLSWKRDY